METTRDYNAAGPLFIRHGSSLAIGVAAVICQLISADWTRQGLDLTGAFFTQALWGQFLHLGWIHLLLNLAGLALVAWGFGVHCSARQWLGIQVASLAWVPFYLAVFEPIDWYLGLSGALHFQFAACLLLAWQATTGKARPQWPLWIMALGLATKLLLEWNPASQFDPMIGGPVAYQAHRGGALGGLLLGLLMIAYQSARRPEPRP